MVVAMYQSLQCGNRCDVALVVIVAVLGAANLISPYVYLIFDNLGGLGPCRIAEHTGS